MVRGHSFQLGSFLAWAKGLLWDNPHQSWFLVILVIINALGSLYGYYWYRDQLSSTPLIWWPFTPDSPLSTTLFALALTLAIWRKENNLFRLIAATAVIKYGLWAVVLISDYWLGGARIELVEAGLWLSHLGMFVEGIIFIRHWAFSYIDLVVVSCWLLLNDFIDYALGWHPYLFRADQYNLALLTAVSLSLLLTAYLVLVAKYSSRQEKSLSRRIYT
ncbi:MAG: DUF1405 domain-containing protein [Clostridia bacterium]|nr:DUF1405 domain-containing protein [Clostridia bacterium]